MARISSQNLKLNTNSQLEFKLNFQVFHYVQLCVSDKNVKLLTTTFAKHDDKVIDEKFYHCTVPL